MYANVAILWLQNIYTTKTQINIFFKIERKGRREYLNEKEKLGKGEEGGRKKGGREKGDNIWVIPIMRD